MAPAAKAPLQRLLRFAAVGGVGFLTDAGLLWLGMHWLGPLTARILSFAAAVTTTWQLNRHWTFRDRRTCHAGREFARYLAVQSLGLAVNFGVYAAALAWLPAPFSRPLAALALASALALVFNFLGLDRAVFPGRSHESSVSPQPCREPS